MLVRLLPIAQPHSGTASLWSHPHEQPPGYEKVPIGGSPACLREHAAGLVLPTHKGGLPLIADHAFLVRCRGSHASDGPQSNLFSAYSVVLRNDSSLRKDCWP